MWAVVAGSSEPGQLVCDPMCGAGTSLIEAARLGRRAAGRRQAASGPARRGRRPAETSQPQHRVRGFRGGRPVRSTEEPERPPGQSRPRSRCRRCASSLPNRLV
ncbi:MAG TPA: hypothetical protein VG253_00730 [Streptosporangiaceae bacterium]|nr:hypothetical protein [Streptosporangiaceae bacterium]